MFGLNGKTAFVTGAGSGIGAAVAAAVVRAGGHVGVFDVDVDRAAATCDALGDDAIALSGDVRSSEHVRVALERTHEHFGSIDIVANVAGVIRYGRSDDFDERDWRFVIDVNLTGTWLVIKHALPLLAQPAASIINTASVQGMASQRLVAAYSASKAAVISLTRTLALDHASDGVRVNCVLPGSVRTPMLRSAAEAFCPDDPDSAIEAWGQQHPLGHVIEPEDVAQVYVFLASDASSAMTGSAIPVDAGLIARLAL